MLIQFPVLPKPGICEKILDRKRMKVNNESTSIIRCGHFDEKYIETLKGMHHTLNFTIFSFSPSVIILFDLKYDNSLNEVKQLCIVVSCPDSFVCQSIQP
jgi:hypothetical protein